MRLLQKDDLAIVSTLYVNAYASRREEEWTIERARTLLTFLQEKSPDLCFIEECEQRIVGAVFASIKPWWNGNHLIIEEIFVDPDAHGQGIGTLLLKTICKEAKERHHATQVEAMTFRDTDFPKQWYFANGFKEIEEWIPLEGMIEMVLGCVN